MEWGRTRLPRAAWLLCALMLMLASAAAERADARAPLRDCSDNIDNDGDGKTDFPFEPGCTAFDDDSEPDPAPAALAVCSNGTSTNNAADGDTLVDFPADPGCTSAVDTSESNPSSPPACANGTDNDSPPDGKIDWPADPGCSWAAETSEADTACSNRLDDDHDGRTDFPADFGCMTTSASALGWNDTTEEDLPQCDDGRDNDLDGLVDLTQGDPDCSSNTDDSEAPPAPAPQCSDGVDNDVDGLVDMIDPGCAFAGDNDETDPPQAAPVVQYVLPQGNLASTKSTPSTTSTSTTPLLTPFPIVRLRGRVDGKGVRVTLLTIRAPAKSKVAVYCSGKSCPRRREAVNAEKELVRMRRFETRLRGGTVLKIYVTKTGYIGKYTRFRFVKNRVPFRTDRCATKPGTRPRNCPVS